ncbi:DUF1828 domain-containing protein [Saccharothrix longispora]|uniref:DUF1828 domain-containing protein n=1 Tax=Saccharothrix longispora TaxID=33920 RepID=A0ABU1Q0S1_9PSEU|nr:DUF1828 domain-containing protein [Saccharothrix longispora]MDR6596471.1 hypothetical protein [Saccharothrix longispora]
MTVDTNLLVDSYVDWITAAISAEVVDEEVVELTTPFLDRHNDHLQIYVEKQASDLYLLTDDGYIVGELKSSGVESRGRRREELLNRLLAGYGVDIVDGELQTKSTGQGLGQRMHSLVQAMLSVDDMFMLSQPSVHGIFFDDVAKFLDDSDVRYTPRAKFSGKSGLDHLVDFVIPKSRNAPERIVQILDTPRRDRVESMLFAVNDTRAARGSETEYYAIVNDLKNVPPEVVNAFSQYSVRAQPWSQREQLVQALAA